MNDYFDIRLLKKCKECGKTFSATIKQTYCDDCRKNVFVKTRKKNIQYIEQNVHCKFCKAFLHTDTKMLTRQIGKNIYTGLCDDCKKIQKEIQRQKRSEWMKNNNPSKNINKINKRKERIPQYRLLGYASFSDYMKEHNPMQDKTIKNKVISTLKRRIKDKEIIYKTGIDHHNWKGNRSLNKAIRDGLGEWRKEVLKKFNYKCFYCNVNNNQLHIHHTEPVKDIIIKFLEENNITDVNTLKDGSKLFIKIVQDIINYHLNNNIGVVVCKDHHDEIDKFYHKPKIK